MVTEPKLDERAPSAPTPSAADEQLRIAAVQRLERVRRFKLNLAAYVVGILVIGGVWAFTEYQNADGWPKRLSDHGQPGDWNPWILWVVLGWGFFVLLDALKLYFQRPTTKEEIDREVERLKGGR